MSWNDLLRKGSVERFAADDHEIEGLIRAGRRQLEDAAVPALSPEASYQLAYTGVLALATAAVRRSGYRLRSGEGHHRRTFEAAALAAGRRARSLIDFFELCRRRRNVISYEGSDATETEARDLLARGNEFLRMVAGD